MILELAPMEGITTYIYRNALHKYYGGIDVYFSPFISTHKDKELNFKEKNDIRPDNNKGIQLIPQVLTANADEFLYTSRQIAQMGYDTVNLNFGCPSGTVTTKGKGAGILNTPELLDSLLDKIFSNTNLKISVKTRVGFSDSAEWEQLLNIYQKYPIEELIIHCRVREDYYNKPAKPEILNTISDDIFSKLKISYNGDIYCINDYNNILNKNQNLYGIMLGRGIISNPGLASQIKIGEEFNLEKFKAFNLEIMDGYVKIMKSDKNTLFKVKELWYYMNTQFENSDKILKKTRKCNSLLEYESIIKGLHI